MPRRARSRPATYGAAARLARIVYGLAERPGGWSLAAIRETLGISQRTLERYVATLRAQLVGPDGRPAVEVVRRGEARALRFGRRDGATDATAYQALSLYLALTVVRFLEGTVLEQGVEDLWAQLYARLPHPWRARIADFDRKFYAIPFTPKDYAAQDDTLDLIVRCLVDQRRMRIDYAPLGAERHTHRFDPYTLAVYRGGLYLIGFSHERRRIVYLAVERIHGAARLDERFEYPARYSPARHTAGAFGLIEGPETAVELLVRDPETAALLRARRLHPTQRFEDRGDGTTRLTMRVRGTQELVNWILGFGAHLEVLAPAPLRREVARRLRQAAALYR
jgi:proteasome accessory factor B